MKLLFWLNDFGASLRNSSPRNQILFWRTLAIGMIIALFTVCALMD